MRASWTWMAILESAAEGLSATSAQACCELCYEKASCLAASYRSSTEECLLGGARYPGGSADRADVLACSPRKAACDLKEGADYIAARGSTVKDVHSTEQCCALCATWEDCKVLLESWFRVRAPKQQSDCGLCGPWKDRSTGGNASRPVLLDGAETLIDMGSRLIKIALFRPAWNYAVNSEWPSDESFPTLKSVAVHEHFRHLWEMDFDTYVLVAYSTAGGRSAGNMAAGYWVQGITEEQEAEEELQFYEAAAFFLETYPHKTFVFTNCEGDWEIRGGLGVQRAPHEAAFASMARWLQARQAGVTRARQRHRMPGAAGNVYLAGEVNLVAESLFEGKPNVVNRVLPFVQLDMVSYSSYDTQQDLREFEAALRYLASQHNRSAWSPNGMSALMLGEFGLPQSKMTLPDITYILGNVINSALAMGVSYILFWETFCNECLPGPGCGADGRCREKVPVTEVDRLNGFWLVWPDGTKAWPWRYLHQKLHEAPESELWALRREREDETGALYGRSTLALLGSAAVAVASIFRYCRVHRRSKKHGACCMLFL
ncbi:unnamed protein product [Durusdinium trenchii]|uniref:Apple domain-containing protein n=1 Tax=Durusdinium trenchii TaxID=1381693 RepID=A0ABP0S9T8_9DINO